MLNWLTKNWIWVALAGGAYFYIKSKQTPAVPGTTTTTEQPTSMPAETAPEGAENPVENESNPDLVALQLLQEKSATGGW